MLKRSAPRLHLVRASLPLRPPFPSSPRVPRPPSLATHSSLVPCPPPTTPPSLSPSGPPTRPAYLDFNSLSSRTNPRVLPLHQNKPFLSPLLSPSLPSLPSPALPPSHTIVSSTKEEPSRLLRTSKEVVIAQGLTPTPLYRGPPEYILDPFIDYTAARMLDT